MAKSFVGIDVSKNTLDVHVLPAGVSKKLPNTPAGHQALVEWLTPFAADGLRAGLESTGGLELPAALALEAAGFEVAIIRPERVRYFAKAEGQRAKTDAIDAAVLARFVATVAVEIHPLPPEEIRSFRDLLDRRGQLIEMRTMESNRLASTQHKPAVRSIEKHLKWLDNAIRDVEQSLDARIAANPKWKQLDAIVQSVPGVGPQTARTLIGQLPELGHVSHKRIAHLVGLAPMNADSGLTEAPRHIVGGRQQVRNVLYMAAIAALKHNPIATARYAALRGQGKAAKVAIIAIARKLLATLNAMVRDQTPWRHLTVAKDNCT